MLKIISGIILSLSILFSLGQAASAGEKMKVVYHISEEGKAHFALNNVRNHIKGMGGAENVEIIVVTHGPGLKAFHEMGMDPKLTAKMQSLQGQGVTFGACGNTIRAQKIGVEDLAEGMFKIDEGGVVRIAKLQQQGYLYIRP